MARGSGQRKKLINLWERNRRLAAYNNKLLSNDPFKMLMRWRLKLGLSVQKVMNHAALVVHGFVFEHFSTAAQKTWSLCQFPFQLNCSYLLVFDRSDVTEQVLEVILLPIFQAWFALFPTLPHIAFIHLHTLTPGSHPVHPVIDTEILMTRKALVIHFVCLKLEIQRPLGGTLVPEQVLVAEMGNRTWVSN